MDSQVKKWNRYFDNNLDTVLFPEPTIPETLIFMPLKIDLDLMYKENKGYIDIEIYKKMFKKIKKQQSK